MSRLNKSIDGFGQLYITCSIVYTLCIDYGILQRGWPSKLSRAVHLPDSEKFSPENSFCLRYSQLGFGIHKI